MERLVAARLAHDEAVRLGLLLAARGQPCPEGFGEVEAVLLGQRACEVLRRDRSQLDEDLAERPSALTLPDERLIEHSLGDQALVDE